MDEKLKTSKVEDSREKFEEPISTVGRAVRMEQIWRDTNLIKKEPPSLEGKLFNTETDENGEYQYCILSRFPDGATIRNLIYYYRGVTLKRVSGTKNCYTSNLIQDIITESFGEKYCPKIYIDGNLLAYGRGKPYFDESAGTLYFGDKEFSEKIGQSVVTVDFYRYMGRKGTSATNDFENADLPFRDTLKHFKNSENDNQTATFKVRGAVKNTNYILPPDNGKFYDKGEETDSGVVLLQENLEDTLWKMNIKVSGGRWEETGNVDNKVYRYFPQNIGNTVVDEGESANDNRGVRE